MYQARVFNVFIASPSDVQEERQILVERINFWNTINSRIKQVVLLPIMYETHGLSRVNLPPQTTINKFVLEHADYVIAVFFSTLGSGGTIEEIEEAVKANKPTSLFFSKKNIPQAQIGTAPDVLKFKEKHQRQTYYHEFSDNNEFINLIDRELSAFVEERLVQPSIEEPDPINLAELSKKSKAILSVLGRTKNPLRVSDFGARFQLDSHDQMIYAGFDRMEWAYWKKAVDDLIGRNMLEFNKSINFGEVYDLTTLGWEVSASLDYEDFDSREKRP